MAMPKATPSIGAPVCAQTQPHNARIILQSTDQKMLSSVRSLKAFVAARGQDPAMINALYRASLKTGVDFDLLILKASMESDLGRHLEAANSSARGIFQYIDATWLGVMKHYGAQLGYANYANAIEFNNRGHATVKNNNKYLKAEILAMRYDPDISALVKAYQIIDETAQLRQIKGSAVTTTDHYITHMLGMPLAKEFYTLRRRNSPFTLANISNPAMREAVAMNKGFFYSGRTPLTARASYKRFENRVEREIKKMTALSDAGDGC